MQSALEKVSADLTLPGYPFQQGHPHPLSAAADKIPVFTAEQMAQVVAWPVTAARAVDSILRERTGFMNRLQQIANLSQIF